MANQIAGHGQHSHEIPTAELEVVVMRDGNSKGGEVYLTRDGTYRFVDLDSKKVDTAERCVLVRLTDVDPNGITGVWICDLSAPDGLALIGCDAGDDIGGEILWDSEA